MSFWEIIGLAFGLAWVGFTAMWIRGTGSIIKPAALIASTGIIAIIAASFLVPFSQVHLFWAAPTIFAAAFLLATLVIASILRRKLARHFADPAVQAQLQEHFKQASQAGEEDNP